MGLTYIKHTLTANEVLYDVGTVKNDGIKSANSLTRWLDINQASNPAKLSVLKNTDC